MLLSYAEYQQMSDRASVTEASFPKLEMLAEQKLDRFTQKRIRNLQKPPDTIKYCMADLVDALSQTDRIEIASSAPLTGFSNDGYSETYERPASAQSEDAGLYGLIVNWLSALSDDDGVPLLYLGV